MQRAFGKSLSKRALYYIYGASLIPRSERPSLAMLDRASADRYLDAVRDAVLAALEGANLDGAGPLLKEGFVYHMILQHEYQHNETMLQTLQLMGGEGYGPTPGVELPPGKASNEEMVHVPGGTFFMGTDDRAWALDNERGAHEVEVPDSYLDATPVTNRAYLAFVEDGGYEREALWDAEGWEWIKKENISAPKHWYQPEPHSWWTQRFGFDEPLPMDAPVVHVSWYEADAYARWAGEEPAVYRSGAPMWADRSFAGIATKISSGSVLAAVRSAAPGLPAEESGVPPFSSGRYAFAHNGAIEGFRRTAMRPLRETLSDASYAGLLGVTDSETIFAGMLDLLREDPEDLTGAAERTVRHVSGVCGDLGVRATLNLAVTSGARMAFTRYSTQGPGGTPCTSSRGQAPSRRGSSSPPSASTAKRDGGRCRSVTSSRWRPAPRASVRSSGALCADSQIPLGRRAVPVAGNFH